MTTQRIHTQTLTYQPVQTLKTLAHVRRPRRHIHLGCYPNAEHQPGSIADSKRFSVCSSKSSPTSTRRPPLSNNCNPLDLRAGAADTFTRTKPAFGATPPSAKRRRLRYRSRVAGDNPRSVQNWRRLNPLASNSFTNSSAASRLRHFIPNDFSSLIKTSSTNQTHQRKMGWSDAYREFAATAACPRY